MTHWEITLILVVAVLAVGGWIVLVRALTP